MRTLQEKYNAIQEGAFSKDHFLAEARMQQPQLITRFNGYDDAVQILKNRGMIQEAKSIQEFSPYGSIAFSGEKEREKETAPLSSLEVGDLVYIPGVSGDNIIVKDKREDGAVGVGHPHNDKVSYQDGTKEVQVVKRANLNEAKEHSFTIAFNFSQEKADINYIQKLLSKAGVKATAKIGNHDELVVFTAADKTELEKAKKTINNNISDEFEYVKNISEAKLTKKSLTDYRYKPTNDMDKYPYEQILRGLRVELEAAGVLGTPTPEEYSKALAKVSKNLAKDSIFYTNQVAGVNPKVDLHDKMVTATAKNTVDTFNGMKKAALKEGFKKLIKKVLSSNLQEGYQAGDKVTFVDSNGGKPTSGVVIQDLGQGNFTFKASQDGKTYSTKGLDRGRWKIEKQVAEAMGDMFGDEERGERAANYGQPGESEYEFYSDPENYNEAEEEFELQGEDEIDYDDENFSDPFIDGDLDESRMGDVYITAQDSDSFKDFLIAVKKEYPATNLRRDIEELKYIWDNRGGEDDSADDISHPRGYEEASDEETEQDLYEAKKSLSELLK